MCRSAASFLSGPNCLFPIAIPVEPHEAVAEVSRLGNVWERLVVVNHG